MGDITLHHNKMSWKVMLHWALIQTLYPIYVYSMSMYKCLILLGDITLNHNQNISSRPNHPFLFSTFLILFINKHLTIFCFSPNYESWYKNLSNQLMLSLYQHKSRNIKQYFVKRSFSIKMVWKSEHPFKTCWFFTF